MERLANETWDLLVVGGGIVGAGALLDAASRGLRVALVERDDIAAGTSSRSSRLIHGGLRYLQQAEIGIVRESLAERARLLRLAPHLVRLEAFMFPLYGRPLVTRAMYEIALKTRIAARGRSPASSTARGASSASPPAEPWTEPGPVLAERLRVARPRHARWSCADRKIGVATVAVCG